MKSGYLYVLGHPSDPDLFKIGVTIQPLKKRLAAHNSNYTEYAGKIVKETGQKWEIKTYIEVSDPYWAESVFWDATGLSEFPGRQGIEVERLDWKQVQAGLDAVKKAGVRPPPEPLPDWVYAYTSWMKKRLEGRDIKLVGYVRSKNGKATYQCSNGHEWRMMPLLVAAGAGCPECGVGKRHFDNIKQAVKLDYLCLLLNPDKPGFIKIASTHCTPEQGFEEIIGEGWDVHRYRDVDDPVLAKSIIWELLGVPSPNNGEPIKIDLSKAEQAFCDLIAQMYREIALIEKKNEGVHKPD
jgi:rubredoxin